MCVNKSVSEKERERERPFELSDGGGVVVEEGAFHIKVPKVRAHQTLLPCKNTQRIANREAWGRVCARVCACMDVNVLECV